MEHVGGEDSGSGTRSSCYDRWSVRLRNCRLPRAWRTWVQASEAAAAAMVKMYRCLGHLRHCRRAACWHTWLAYTVDRARAVRILRKGLSRLVSTLPTATPTFSVSHSPHIYPDLTPGEPRGRSGDRTVEICHREVVPCWSRAAPNAAAAGGANTDHVAVCVRG